VRGTTASSGSPIRLSIIFARARSEAELLLPHHTTLPVATPDNLVCTREDIFSRPGKLDFLLSTWDDDGAGTEALGDAPIEIFAAKLGLVQGKIAGGPVVFPVGKDVDTSVTVVDVDDGKRVRSGRVERVLDGARVTVRTREKSEDLPSLKLHRVDTTGRGRVNPNDRDGWGGPEEGPDKAEGPEDHLHDDAEDKVQDFEWELADVPNDIVVIDQQGE